MTVKQREYAEGFREQALAKVLGRSENQSVRSIAADLGMNMGTLRGWMKQALRDQKSPSGKTISSADWTRRSACSRYRRVMAWTRRR